MNQIHKQYRAFGVHLHSGAPRKKSFQRNFFLKDLGRFGIQAPGELLSATISQPEAVKFLLHLKPEIKKKLIIHVKRKE